MHTSVAVPIKKVVFIASYRRVPRGKDGAFGGCCLGVAKCLSDVVIPLDVSKMLVIIA